MPRLRRKPKPYVEERDRLLKNLAHLAPDTEQYHTILQRVNEIDKILNRSTDKFKTLVAAAGPAVAIAGVYGLQQFGGVLVPKALETYAARQDTKKAAKELD